MLVSFHVPPFGEDGLAVWELLRLTSMLLDSHTTRPVFGVPPGLAPAYAYGWPAPWYAADVPATTPLFTANRTRNLLSGGLMPGVVPVKTNS